MSSEREARALAIMEAAGIELDNSKPGGTRRWFAGPGSPTIEGISELERVAYYVGLTLAPEIDPDASEIAGVWESLPEA